jgi:hypothetical protein
MPRGHYNFCLPRHRDTRRAHGLPKVGKHRALASPRAIGVGAIVRVGRRTLNEWKDQYPEFRDACEIGTELALMWWENVIRSGYTESKHADKVNMKVVSFFLRNRFPTVPMPREDERKIF